MHNPEDGRHDELRVTPRKTLMASGLFALAGVVFSGISSYDFIAHLDRQVHAITCSIVPGLALQDASSSSVCHAAVVSPYSLALGDNTWGYDR
jgi:hypothetical protein